MASARSPRRLSGAIALCTTRTPSGGTPKRSRIGTSAAASRLVAIVSLGCRRRLRLDLLDQVEAAVDVAERQATQLREFEFPPLHTQQPLDGLFRKPVADDCGGNATDDGVGRDVLGDHRPGGDHRTVANVDASRDIDVMAGPYVVADGHVLEHVGCALEPDEVVVLVDPVKRFGVILELVGTEPAGRMVERIDRGTRADRSE